jgi:ABC-type branched-subunit amino acid transport system substrate-binding protein
LILTSCHKASVWDPFLPVEANELFHNKGAQQMTSRIISALLLVGLFLLVQQVAAQDSVINFGISLSLSPTGTLRQTQSLSVWEGLQLWLEKVNAQGGSVIRNATFTYNITKYEDDGVLDNVIPLYRQMLNDSSIDYLMGPINSDFTIPLLAYTEPAQRLLVATSAGSDSFYRGNNFAFSVVQPSSR